VNSSESLNPVDGLIRRSMRFDERNSPQHLAYTSIILDAGKPTDADEVNSGLFARS
jgi:predicted SAM-dependent methyltransferase